jgi:hypothetical protein
VILLTLPGLFQKRILRLQVKLNIAFVRSFYRFRHLGILIDHYSLLSHVAY